MQLFLKLQQLDRWVLLSTTGVLSCFKNVLYIFYIKIKSIRYIKCWESMFPKVEHVFLDTVCVAASASREAENNLPQSGPGGPNWTWGQLAELQSERTRSMQTRRLRAQSRTVCGRLRGTPVPQRSLGSLAVSQPVGDGESSVSLQLGQNHQHLSEREERVLNLPRFIL